MPKGAPQPQAMSHVDLSRFIDAQKSRYDIALDEIRRGKKRTHWMWFIFPQIAGLGRSETARHYSIVSLAEARAYMDHALLGRRLRECITALQDLPGSRSEEVFGELDALKLRSSLTLFEQATKDPLFSAAIERWFGGERDAATLAILERQPSSDT